MSLAQTHTDHAHEHTLARSSIFSSPPTALPNHPFSATKHKHPHTQAHTLSMAFLQLLLSILLFVCIISHWLQCKNTDAKQRFKLVINHKAEFLKESFDILGNMLILFFSLSHSLRLLKVTITIILMPICLNPTHSQVRMSTCGCKQLFPPTSKVCIAAGSH